jgi:hypothetical protein
VSTITAARCGLAADATDGTTPATNADDARLTVNATSTRRSDRGPSM